MHIDGEIQDLAPGLQVDRYKVHDIELVIDRLKVNEERRDRLTNSTQMASKMGGDLVMIADHEDNNKCMDLQADDGVDKRWESFNTCPL